MEVRNDGGEEGETAKLIGDSIEERALREHSCDPGEVLEHDMRSKMAAPMCRIEHLNTDQREAMARCRNVPLKTMA